MNETLVEFDCRTSGVVCLAVIQLASASYILLQTSFTDMYIPCYVF